MNVIKKALWRISKVSGLKLIRGPQHVESLLTTICDFFSLKLQRGDVIKAATRLHGIAQDGWLATGRRWGELVVAAFVLAAQTYHFRVDMPGLCRFMSMCGAVLEHKILAMKKLLCSVLKLMPW